MAGIVAILVMAGIPCSVIFTMWMTGHFARICPNCGEQTIVPGNYVDATKTYCNNCKLIFEID